MRWYSERQLYEVAPQSQEIGSGYQDGEASECANAAVSVARDLGFEAIARALVAGRRPHSFTTQSHPALSVRSLSSSACAIASSPDGNTWESEAIRCEDPHLHAVRHEAHLAGGHAVFAAERPEGGRMGVEG